LLKIFEYREGQAKQLDIDAIFIENYLN
jgi:hypothetical protein